MSRFRPFAEDLQDVGVQIQTRMWVSRFRPDSDIDPDKIQIQTDETNTQTGSGKSAKLAQMLSDPREVLLAQGEALRSELRRAFVHLTNGVVIQRTV